MSSLLKIWLGILLLGAVLLAVGLYALFHGYFDHGLFEIKQAEWYPFHSSACCGCGRAFRS